ncbi:MAG: hypothetical protein N4A35_05370 [Flavobacteriales bacterium]|jgi:predicted phage terminase large subunit-like protein|nr:hypothetical protein [Flavobacteriales bacterium]
MANVNRNKALKRYLANLEFIRETGDVNADNSLSARTQRIERAKRDVKYMVEYYFPHYATSECADFHIEFAEMVKKQKAFKGFAEWGRGLAKSVWSDILIPFWLWLNDDCHYMVIIGNNYDKAKMLLSDIQAEFEANPRIRQDFGEQKTLGSWENGNFRTKSGFIGKALGMGQSVRGLRVKSQRPDLCICDDLEGKQLIKNPKRQDEMAEWILRDLIPTMDGDLRRFIQANNRFAPRMIQTVLQEKRPNWTIHHIKAYDPVTHKPIWYQKYSDTYYKELETEVGTLAALAEFNNEPHIEGKIFKTEYIQWAKLPRVDHFDCIVGFWDVAYAGTQTADYNAIRVWGIKDKDFFYIDSFVKKTKMRSALEWMADFSKNLPKSVIINWRFEAQFWNDEVERTISEVEKDHQIHLNIVKADRPKANKYERILTLHPYYQNGRIYYNEKKKGHNDTQIGLAQLYGIEPGYKGHDDAPDADQQAIEYLSAYIQTSTFQPILGMRQRPSKVW